MNKFSVLLATILISMLPCAHAAEPTAEGEVNPQVLRAEAPAAAESEENTNSSGVTVAAAYKTEVHSAVVGGANSDINLAGTLNFDVGLDLDKLLKFRGLSTFVSVNASHGGAFNEQVGDIQYASNLQSLPGARLYQAYAKEALFGERLTLSVGIQDLNNEFYLSDNAATLINSSFGMGAELGATGAHGPSTFPQPGLGAMATVEPGADFHLGIGAYEGDSDLAFNAEEGALLVGELKHRHTINGLGGALSVGGWAYTAQQEARGAYAMAEQILWKPDLQAQRSLAAFARAGWANAAAGPTVVATNLAAGVNLTAPLPGRFRDQFAMGITSAIPGDGSGDATETAIEWTYRARFWSWLAVQPDLQLILKPGMNEAAADTLVGGVRLEASI